MISALHLFWIIPISIMVSIVFTGLVNINSKCEKESRIYREGYSAGVHNTTKLYKLENCEPIEPIKYNKKIKFAVEQELMVPDNLDDAELNRYLMKRFNGRDYIYSENLDKSLF